MKLKGNYPHFTLIIYTPSSGRVGGSPVASVQACESRNPSSSPDIRWLLFFGITAEWPKITQMLP